MDRISLLLGPSDWSTPILELGAGDDPVAPKAAGWQTHAVDHATAAERRQKSSIAGVAAGKVEEADSVWRAGNLHDAVPTPLHGRFQRLIASHVLEHIPDPIAFFESAARLLHPDGVVALALSDRRYCLDLFKPASTTGDLLEAFAARRSRHALRNLWNDAAYSVAVDGSMAWGQHPVAEARFVRPFTTAAEAVRSFRDDFAAAYVDCRAWHFTPSGFALAMLELAQLRLLEWRIDTLTEASGYEFIAVLRRGVEGFATPADFESRRLALLREQLQEQREQIDQALAGGLLPPQPATEAGRAPTAPVRSREQPLAHAIDATWCDSHGAYVVGWVHGAGQPVHAVRLRCGEAVAAASERRPRPDIAAGFRNCPDDACFGFGVYLACRPFRPVMLEVVTASGTVLIPVDAAPDPAGDEPDALTALQLRFTDGMQAARGSVLELGARSFSGVTWPWQEQFGPDCRYIRSDVHPAPEIDLVADAHDLTRVLGEGSLDGVFSCSVLEHLAAPWLVAAEINRVLKIGGLTYHLVPLIWPLHEQPNDFWRFSDEALRVLFSAELGFEVIDTVLVPGFSVHPGPRHRLPVWVEMPLVPAHSSAAILARKVAQIAPDAVRWPTDRAALRQRARDYPRHGGSDSEAEAATAGGGGSASP